MAAQAKEEFSKLDHVSQKKLKNLGKDIVIKASTLKPEDMTGVTIPLGFWDPAGLTKRGNIAAYREAELKHGRVCMLAVLGIIVGERHDFIPLLGQVLAKDVPAYLLGTPFVQETSVAQ